MTGLHPTHDSAYGPSVLPDPHRRQLNGGASPIAGSASFAIDADRQLGATPHLELRREMDALWGQPCGRACHRSRRSVAASDRWRVVLRRVLQSPAPYDSGPWKHRPLPEAGSADD